LFVIPSAKKTSEREDAYLRVVRIDARFRMAG
jgi:hypothetical protein